MTDGRPRLILLNGLPGVGKSTLARAYVADRPGVLNLDIDVLRTLLGGDWSESAELGRTLGLQVAAAHLANGHDVVIPQLVARQEQLARFEAAATGFAFVMVHVQGPSDPGDQPWQRDIAPDELRWYAENLARLADGYPSSRALQIVPGDVPATVAELARLLDHAE